MFLIMLLLSSNASATIYFSIEPGSAKESAIGRVDSGNVDPLFITKTPHGVNSLYGTKDKLYFSDISHGGILSANKNSFDLSYLSRNNHDSGSHVIVGNYVYYIANYGEGIYRSNLDGSQVVKLLSDTEVRVEGNSEAITALTSDGKYLYFAFSPLGEIERMNLDGSERQIILDFNDNEFNYISNLTILGDYIYWFDSGLNTIRRTPKNGSAVNNSSFINLNNPLDDGTEPTGFNIIALDNDGKNLYWVVGSVIYQFDGNVSKKLVDVFEEVFLPRNAGYIGRLSYSHDVLLGATIRDIYVDETSKLPVIHSGLSIEKKISVLKNSDSKEKQIKIKAKCSKDCSGLLKLSKKGKVVSFSDYRIKKGKKSTLNFYIPQEIKGTLTLHGSKFTTKKIIIKK